MIQIHITELFASPEVFHRRGLWFARLRYYGAGQCRPYRQTTVEIKDYLLHLSAGKFFGKLHVELSGSYSDLNDLNQQKSGARLSWFPYGKYKLEKEGDYTKAPMNQPDDKSAKKGLEMIE